MSGASATPLLAVRGLRAGYGGRDVVDGLDLAVGAGQWLGLIGPNGGGKSTAVKAMTGVLRPRAGEVTLGGHDIHRQNRRWVAQRLAVVSQEEPADFGYTVAEVVAMGRLPHLSWLRPEGPEDRAAVAAAMAKTGLTDMADRSLATLSGGEKQRVFLARALAQQPAVLVLDEPTTHLDIAYQVALCELLRRLCDDEGLAVVTVLHDLTLAGQYCDELVLLSGGRALAAGPPAAVLDEALIAAAYGGPVLVLPHPQTGRPAVLPGVEGLHGKRRSEVGEGSGNRAHGETQEGRDGKDREHLPPRGAGGHVANVPEAEGDEHPRPHGER